jgi:hypothetical protein
MTATANFTSPRKNGERGLTFDAATVQSKSVTH